MHRQRTHRIVSNALFAALGLTVAATSGCGFLDEDLHKSKAEFEASFALEGSGASRESRVPVGSFECGVGSMVRSTSIDSLEAIPPRLPRNPDALGTWFRRNCRGTRAPLCRLVLRQLRMKNGASYAALSGRGRADGADEEDSGEGPEPEGTTEDRREGARVAPPEHRVRVPRFDREKATSLRPRAERR